MRTSQIRMAATDEIKAKKQSALQHVDDTKVGPLFFLNPVFYASAGNGAGIGRSRRGGGERMAFLGL